MRRPRLTYANVVATVIAPKIKALAVKQGKIANGAVSGAKLANGAVGGEKLAEGAVTTSKLANGAVTGEKADESSFGQVPSAAKADFATSAESANPVAFARVTGEGKVDASFAKGIAAADVIRKAAGVYCVAVPGFSPRGAQVSAEVNVSDVVVAMAKVNPVSSCVAPQVEVLTYKNATTLGDEPFYVALYR